MAIFIAWHMSGLLSVIGKSLAYMGLHPRRINFETPLVFLLSFRPQYSFILKAGTRMALVNFVFAVRSGPSGGPLAGRSLIRTPWPPGFDTSSVTTTLLALRLEPRIPNGSVFPAVLVEPGFITGRQTRPLVFARRIAGSGRARRHPRSRACGPSRPI
jgi:hypothetical protein